MNLTLNSIVVTDSDGRVFRVTNTVKYGLKIEGHDGDRFYTLSHDELEHVEMLADDENYEKLLNIFKSVK